MEIAQDELIHRLGLKLAILAVEGDLLREENAGLRDALVHAQAQVELLTPKSKEIA